MTDTAGDRLAFIFGERSTGRTAEERAATSDRHYVRSQVQLALHSPRAKGVRLNARQALHSFGLDLLERVAEDGAAGIVSDPRQPADTLLKRRRYLNVSRGSLAAAAGVPVDSIARAETAGKVVPIRDLEKIAQLLALDERVLGFRPAALGDRKLGARLRDLNPIEDRDDGFIMALADAAWVIGREAELRRELHREGASGQFTRKLDDYRKPAYRTGYELAERTRQLIGLSDREPIANLRALVDQRLGIPVLDVEMAASVAGATVGNGGVRGIILAMSDRPLVRRMTLSHELGHLLWDPDPILNRVRVDNVDENVGKQQDPVEIRANAFGIAFLAPRAAVRDIHARTGSPARTVAELVERFGISHSAAANHLRGVCELDIRSVDYSPPRGVFEHWAAAEAVERTVPAAPLNRSGSFAALTLEAVARGLVTRDTAAMWLHVDVDALPGG